MFLRFTWDFWCLRNVNWKLFQGSTIYLPQSKWIQFQIWIEFIPPLLSVPDIKLIEYRKSISFNFTFPCKILNTSFKIKSVIEKKFKPNRFFDFEWFNAENHLKPLLCWKKTKVPFFSHVSVRKHGLDKLQKRDRKLP